MRLTEKNQLKFTIVERYDSPAAIAAHKGVSPWPAAAAV